MGQYRPILLVSIFFTMAALALWGTAFDMTARGADLRAVTLIRPGAVTLTVLAGLLWVARWQARRDRDKAILIRTLADVAPAARRELVRTRPLRRVQ